MNCNDDIHNELEVTEILCPFCDKRIAKSNLIKSICCNNQKVINDNSMQVCVSCGIVQGYNFSKEYVDFYYNMSRFQRKSVYHREYHINNTIIDIEQKYNIKISTCQKNKIDAIFCEIGKILYEVNGTRKRMISVNFIMRKIFKMMGIPFENIPISKSKKTLAFCDKYWKHIMLLIGNKIKFIIG